MLEWGHGKHTHTLKSSDRKVDVIDFITGDSRQLLHQPLDVRNRPVIVSYPTSNPEVYAWVKNALQQRHESLLCEGINFSNRQQVMWSPDLEQGLHAVTQPEITQVDGERVFDASHTSNLKLVIDTSFFESFTEDVIFSLEVKAKHNATRRPGFNIKFDDYTPTRYEPLDNANEGWNSIPDGDFIKKSWKINSLSAAGSFGYQISLDSDSTETSQYLIRRITIRRLP